MNERKFLKELNSDVNKDGDFTPSIVNELIYQGRQIQIAKKETRFTRLLRRIRKTKSVSQIVEDNIEMILARTSDQQISSLLRRLVDNEETLGVVAKKIDSILARLQEPQDREEDSQMHIMDCARSEFLSEFKRTQNAQSVLTAHMDNILQGTITLEDVVILQGLSQETDEKINQKLEREKEIVARSMLDDIAFSEKSVKQRTQLIEAYVPTVTRILEELLAEQNVKMVDIEPKGSGAYSRVYQIGAKVLKIGLPRETYKIPNHPRILQPLTRTNLIDEREKNKICGCIEISDAVDKLKEEEFQVEKLYQVYKELRDEGIIWTDARFSNVGKLRRRNVPTLNGEEMNVDPVAVGMDKQIESARLEAGDWVILDTDFIYRQEEPTIIWAYGNFVHSQQFEKRWQQEKQGQIVAKYQKNERAGAEGENTKSYEVRSWRKDKKKDEER